MLRNASIFGVNVKSSKGTKAHATNKTLFHLKVGIEHMTEKKTENTFYIPP